MKKVLIVAALLATVAGQNSFASAAAMAPAAAAPKPICYILPFTADCMTAWKAEGDGMMMKMKAAAPKMAAPKVAIVMPKMTMPTMPKMTMPKMSMPTMPNCTKAAAGAGHLYDCKM